MNGIVMIKEVEFIENAVSLCGGVPTDADLPQIQSETQAGVDLIHEVTGEPVARIEEQLNQQLA